MTRTFFVALSGVALLAAGVAAQSAARPPAAQPVQPAQQPPAPPPVVYSVDVALVEVDAVVTDGNGRVIPDLGRLDFRISEDGKPQTIDRVSFVEIPIRRAGERSQARAAADDVRSNLQRFEGRLYVLLLDDLHTATLRGERVKAAARRFVEQSLQPGDLAAVIHVSGAGGASQEFTTDRRLLLESIERFAGRKLRSETLNRVDDYNRQLLFRGRTPEGTSDVDEGPRAHDARSVFETIREIATRVAPVRGRRKALLWFGEGVAYDMYDSARRTQASVVLESSRAAIAAASRANLAIYGIDARGLAGLVEEAVQLGTVAADPTQQLDSSGLRQELLRSQDNLRGTSNDTGGFAVVNTAEFATAFERVVEENSAYYLLGYYSTNERRDGTFRRIEVHVDRPGARVRARSGYVAPVVSTEASGSPTESDAPALLKDALLGPVPRSDLPMAAHTAIFTGEGGKASVFVTVEYGALAFQGSGIVAADRDRLDTSVVAIAPSGSIEASDHSTVALNVKPETRRAMEVLGFRTHSRLELRPGRYQVRVAGAAAGTGLVGSVYQDLEVPDFSKLPLALGGPVVTSVVAGYTPTARLDERLREALPSAPTTTRDFRNDEAIALFTEVYEAGRTPTRDVTLRTSMRNDAGEVVFSREDIRTAAQLKSNAGYSLQIPLGEFGPGDYVLRVEAESRAAENGTAGREVSFQIWEVPPSDPPPATTPVSSGPPAPLPIVPVAKGALSQVTEAREMVARNDADWQALWSLLSSRRAAPAVAFESTMIVAVFLGPRPTAGYEPEIVGVRRDGDVLVVEWHEHTPQDAGNPPAVTHPFAAVGVPRHDGEVRFEKVGAAPRPRNP